MRPRRLLLVAAVVVLLLAAYAAWSLWQVRGDLLAARADAERLQSVLREGDPADAEAEAALAALQEHSRAAADRTDGPLWSALAVLPVVGDDVDGVRRLSGTLADLVEDGVDPLVSVAGDLSAGAFLPKDGRVPIGRVGELERPVSSSARAFSRAAAELGEGDPDGYVGALASAYSDLDDRISEGAEALTAAATATRLVPQMLGAEGERRYVLVFQNNAELRTTGGMAGASALLVARDGRLELDRQIGGLPYRPEPVLPLTREERYLYGTKVGGFYQDANFTPHFPRAAELWAEHWRRNFGVDPDGVLAMDPVALSYLLEGTGPVQVGGTTLTSQNAVDVLLNESYQRLDTEQQNVFFAQAARVVFDTVASGEGDPRAIVEALARGVHERRVLLSSFDAQEQAELAGTRIAGELAGAEGTPQLGVFLNDSTESKMSYYLDHEVTVTAGECAGGRQPLHGTVTLSSSAPVDGEGLSESILGNFDGDVVPRGGQLVQVELYAPQGGGIQSIKVDGKDRPLFPTRHRDHPVMQTSVLVQPQKTYELTFEMTASAGEERDLDVRVTPGVAEEDESSVVRLGC